MSSAPRASNRAPLKIDEQALLGASDSAASAKLSCVLNNNSNSAQSAKNCGLGTTLFAELAAGAGVRAYARRPLTRRGCAYKYWWRTKPGRRKMDQAMHHAEICGHSLHMHYAFWGGLIDVLVLSVSILSI
jgi:hypothetical protein